MNRAVARLGAAAGAFVLLAALFGAYFFDPAVPPAAVVFGAWVALSLGAGLVASSWWALLLALPAGIAVYQHVALEAAGFVAMIVAIATAVLLAVTIPVGKRSRRARRVGAALVAACLLTIPIGLLRQVRPLNVTPLTPVVFDLELGSVDDAHLDEEIADVLARYGTPDLPEQGVASWDGLTVWYDNDVVYAVQVEHGRFQTRDGVGVGDSLAYARHRWPGLVCDRDGYREPYCAGLVGLNLLLVEGNPIRAITVSNDRCRPEVMGLWPAGADTCEEGTRVLRPVKPDR